MGTWQFSSWNLRSLFGFRNSPEISQDASSKKLEISGVANNRFYHLYYPLIDDKKAENRMRDERLVAHSVRSHGIVVARTHMNDWLILILLAVIMMVLSRIHPFYRYVGKDMMTDLKYPLKENTVPLWVVPVYAVLFPMGVFISFYFYRRDVYDLHHAILGLLFSVLITGVITDAIKDAVGRPRPDFFWRCFPDGKDFYDQLGDVICHGDSNVVKEGHKSFPSGHTSWSFSGLGFLSLYLSGKVRVFDRKGHVAKLCMVFLPLLVASLVGISRVDDYWHHWQDVFAGGIIGKINTSPYRVSNGVLDCNPISHLNNIYLSAPIVLVLQSSWGAGVAHVSLGRRWMVSGAGQLSIHTIFDAGITVATFCYLQFFAPPYHAEGWGPYAFFRAVEESRSNAQESGPPLTQTNVLSSEPHLALDDLESAMR